MIAMSRKRSDAVRAVRWIFTHVIFISLDPIKRVDMYGKNKMKWFTKPY